MEGSKYLVCGSTGEWNKDKPKCKRKLSRQFEELLCLLLLWEGSGWYTFLWRVWLFIWNTVSPNTFTTEFRKKNYSYCYGYKYCHGLSSFNCVIFPITVIGDLFYVIIFFLQFQPVILHSFQKMSISGCPIKKRHGRSSFKKKYYWSVKRGTSKME